MRTLRRMFSYIEFRPRALGRSEALVTRMVFLPQSSQQRREISKFEVLTTTPAYKCEFFTLYIYSETALTNFFWTYFVHNVRREQEGIIAKDLQMSKVIFWDDVFVDVAVVDFKLPTDWCDWQEYSILLTLVLWHSIETLIRKSPESLAAIQHVTFQMLRKMLIATSRVIIDLFTFYVLFSHFRPRNVTLGNGFFQMSSYARAYVCIAYEKNTKGKSRGLKWENKTYKLEVYCVAKRSWEKATYHCKPWLHSGSDCFDLSGSKRDSISIMEKNQRGYSVVRKINFLPILFEVPFTSINDSTTNNRLHFLKHTFLFYDPFHEYSLF